MLPKHGHILTVTCMLLASNATKTLPHLKRVWSVTVPWLSSCCVFLQQVPQQRQLMMVMRMMVAALPLQLHHAKMMHLRSFAGCVPTLLSSQDTTTKQRLWPSSWSVAHLEVCTTLSTSEFVAVALGSFEQTTSEALRVPVSKGLPKPFQFKALTLTLSLCHTDPGWSNPVQLNQLWPAGGHLIYHLACGWSHCPDFFQQSLLTALGQCTCLPHQYCGHAMIWSHILIGGVKKTQVVLGREGREADQLDPTTTNYEWTFSIGPTSPDMTQLDMQLGCHTDPMYQLSWLGLDWFESLWHRQIVCHLPKVFF